MLAVRAMRFDKKLDWFRREAKEARVFGERG
jgi:hypothetical protein